VKAQGQIDGEEKKKRVICLFSYEKRTAIKPGTLLRLEKYVRTK
jgi:hypothetical protein